MVGPVELLGDVLERDTSTSMIMIGVTDFDADSTHSLKKSPPSFVILSRPSKYATPLPVLTTLLLFINTTARGRLVTDDWLRLLGAPSVFALGDCAVINDKPLPQTAQVIPLTLGWQTIV